MQTEDSSQHKQQIESLYENLISSYRVVVERLLKFSKLC